MSRRRIGSSYARIRALLLTTLLVLSVGTGRADATEIPGWQKEWPSPQQMLQGRDPAQAQPIPAMERCAREESARR